MDKWRAYCLYRSIVIVHIERGQRQASLMQEKSACLAEVSVTDRLYGNFKILGNPGGMSMCKLPGAFFSTHTQEPGNDEAMCMCVHEIFCVPPHLPLPTTHTHTCAHTHTHTHAHTHAHTHTHTHAHTHTNTHRYCPWFSGGGCDWCKEAAVWYLGRHCQPSQQDGEHRHHRKDTGVCVCVCVWFLTVSYYKTHTQGTSSLHCPNYTVDREIFTLKIIRMKNVRVVKFSWFLFVWSTKFFLTVDNCNVDERSESSWRLVYYQVSGKPGIAGCSRRSDTYLRKCGLAHKIVHRSSPRNFIFAC